MTASSAPATPIHHRWWFWAAVALVAASLLFPLLLGNDLRLLNNQRLLDQNWQPDNRIMPALGRAHAQSLKLKGQLPPAELDSLWQGLEKYRGSYPEFFWMEIAWLEARAGRWERAKAAVEKAKAIDPRIVDMARGPAWDGLRDRLGIKP